ncbi:MAG: aminotransferase class I/II-fold pyridoxal phosphate-dependent enzyme [Saprospiraceae bacterium]|nr:aminotransferase class I/II-fold pyridoxal phosphate-dependent enzyme [Saprospiraceae bacterium]MDW8228558.1 aminotransferase class I/II-fold pyridoxal phosphate-dependent enzyme [Saprospiraceae bacterium]
MISKPSMRPDSFVVKEQAENRTTAPHILPIYATSSFAFDNLDACIEVFRNPATAHTYSRYGNPTTDAVARKIAELEAFGLGIEAYGIMTSSGMSAISALLLGLLRSGDQLLTQGNLYGGTTELLADILQPLGVEVLFINLRDLDQVEQTLRTHPRIRMVYAETPANPTLACIDLKAVAQLAHKHDAWLAVDNTFATPLLQQPFAFGADFIVHSATKFLNGHGNSIAGVVIGRDTALTRQRIWRTVKLIGANCSPFEAWLAHNGLKTLALRMERHSANALALAQFLEQHPAVARVNYPGLPSHLDAELARQQMRGGFGAMLSFELKDGFDAALRCVNRLKFCSLAPTLGDVDTLVLHPASSSHLNVPRELRLQNGITDGLVRVSVGIENSADIIADFGQALEQ